MKIITAIIGFILWVVFYSLILVESLSLTQIDGLLESLVFNAPIFLSQHISNHSH